MAFRRLERNPDEAYSLFVIGCSYDREGKLEKAVEYYKKAEKNDSSIYNLHSNLAYTYWRLDGKSLERVEQECNLELRYGPNPDAYINRALVHRSRGDNEKAFQDYEKAVNIAWGELEIYLIAACFSQQYKIHQRKGIQFLERAFSVDPDSWRAWELKVGFITMRRNIKKQKRHICVL